MKFICLSSSFIYLCFQSERYYKGMKVQLGEIAKIQFGLYTQPEDAGNTAYLQAKHFDEWNRVTSPLDTFINIDNKSKGHLLKDGDILLVGKGFRTFAWTYGEAIGPAVASSIFFVIRPDRKRVLPEFLTLIFNAPQTQSYFQTLGAGSSIPSIRKSELEAFPVALPPVEVQQKAIEIKKLHDHDVELSSRIMAEKKRLFQAITQNLIYQHNG